MPLDEKKVAAFKKFIEDRKVREAEIPLEQVEQHEWTLHCDVCDTAILKVIVTHMARNFHISRLCGNCMDALMRGRTIQ